MLLDKEMGGPVVNDNAKADDLIRILEAYSNIVQNSHPDKSVDLLLKAAGLAKTIGNSNKAIQLYYNVGEKMPQHPKAPGAFMMAFIYENDLKDLDKAKATYEEFLKRYPKDPDYADDAQNALKYLGLSAEEIIRQFEKKPQQSAAMTPFGKQFAAFASTVSAESRLRLAPTPSGYLHIGNALNFILNWLATRLGGASVTSHRRPRCRSQTPGLRAGHFRIAPVARARLGRRPALGG